MSGHDITCMSGRDLGARLNRLSDRDWENTKEHRFYVLRRDSKTELFKIVTRAGDNQPMKAHLRFGDGENARWSKQDSLKQIKGQYRDFLTCEIGSCTRTPLLSPKLKVGVMLLLEVAKKSHESRCEADLAIRSALKKKSSISDMDDLIEMFVVGKKKDKESVQRRHQAFERIMTRQAIRDMRSVLRKGYFTPSSKKKLRKVVVTFNQANNVCLRDAVKTMMKILDDDECFSLRNKEAFKIILNVFESTTKQFDPCY